MPGLRLTVRGKVQGVGFRWFVREAARRADLAGWVRNLPDGSVEVRAAGSEQSLGYLLSAVRRGPERARVDEITQAPIEDEAALERPFKVLRER
jgi:acylphosphatase